MVDFTKSVGELANLYASGVKIRPGWMGFLARCRGDNTHWPLSNAAFRDVLGNHGTHRDRDFGLGNLHSLSLGAGGRLGRIVKHVSARMRSSMAKR
jgi:hypothetical protein